VARASIEVKTVVQAAEAGAGGKLLVLELIEKEGPQEYLLVKRVP
jgi:hypothetical protein